MKSNSLRSIEQDEALLIFSESINYWNEKISPIQFLNEVLDNRILIINANKQISFFHELVLEYFTAIQLKQDIALGKNEQIFDDIKPEWIESIIILSCILNNPDKLLDSIYKNNIILAARCISAGAKVSNVVVLQLYTECERRLNNENKTEFETITALLELSTSDSFRLVVKHLAQRKYSFTTALNKCQRPEIIATKLLNFGLTGKNRIRQCLKVFVGKPNSSSFINSPVVANAQIVLMGDTVESDDLYIINELGVSKEAFGTVKEKTLEIISQKNVISRVFIEACELLAKIIPEKTIYEEIKDIILKEIANFNEGSELYGGLRIISSIHKIIDINEAIDKLFLKLLAKKYYRLLSVYLDSLTPQIIDGRTTSEFIKTIIPNIIEDGKINTLLEYREKYPEEVFSGDLIKGFKQCLVQKLTNNSFRYFHEIFNLLTPKDIADISTKIFHSDKSHFKTSGLVKWINKLNLLPYFYNYAIVINNFGHFGYAQKIDNGEIYHFPIKNHVAEKFQRNSLIKINLIKEKSKIHLNSKRRILSSIISYEIVT